MNSTTGTKPDTWAQDTAEQIATLSPARRAVVMFAVNILLACERARDLLQRVTNTPTGGART